MGGLPPRCGQLVGVVLLDRHEVRPGDDRGGQPPGPGADQLTLDAALPTLAVDEVVEHVRQVAGEPVPVRLVAARLHQPVDHVQPVPQVAEPCLPVQQAAALDAAVVPRLADGRLQGQPGDADALGVLGHPVRGARCRVGQSSMFGVWGAAGPVPILPRPTRVINTRTWPSVR